MNLARCRSPDVFSYLVFLIDEPHVGYPCSPCEIPTLLQIELVHSSCTDHYKGSFLESTNLFKQRLCLDKFVLYLSVC